MWLLKTYSHTSQRLGYEARKNVTLTLFGRWLVGGTGYLLAGLPGKFLMILTFAKLRSRRKAALIPWSWWHLRAPFPSHNYSEYETPSQQYENGPNNSFEVITGLRRNCHLLGDWVETLSIPWQVCLLSTSVVIPTFVKPRSRGESALLIPRSWWLNEWKGSRRSHLMIVPNTKRHSNNANTDQLPMLR